MSVLTRSFKQTNGYFVPLADIRANLLSYSGGSGQGGDYKVGSLTPAVWANSPTVGAASTLVQVANRALLKDMGKTVVSANRTFRKVQLVVPGLSTSGVTEVSGDATYLSAYLELPGAGGMAGGMVANVAYLPGLM